MVYDGQSLILSYSLLLAEVVGAIDCTTVRHVDCTTARKYERVIDKQALTITDFQSQFVALQGQLDVQGSLSDELERQINRLEKEYDYMDNRDNCDLHRVIDEKVLTITDPQSQIGVLEATIAAAASAELTAENVTTPAFWVVPGARKHHVKHAKQDCIRGRVEGRELVEAPPNGQRRVCKICTR